MAQLPLVIYPDTILKKRSVEIANIDGDLVSFGHAMAVDRPCFRLMNFILVTGRISRIAAGLSIMGDFP